VVWQPVAERLVAGGRRVCSFDFRGHGDSDPAPDGVYAWSGFGDDADAVLDHLGWRGHPRLLAAGHSKGGAALLMVAMRDPEALPRVWTFEPIIFPTDIVEPLPPDNSMSATARKRRAVWPSREAAIESYGARPPLEDFAPDALRAYVEYGFRDLPDGTVELKCRPEAEASVYMMGAANGLYGRLGDVTVPTLLACGELSRSISPELAAQLVAVLPDATLEVWPGHGHFGPQADPDAAVRSMLAFAARS
jgi:pimeloyl-ACP methyl ester carboxylesterase